MSNNHYLVVGRDLIAECRQIGASVGIGGLDSHNNFLKKLYRKTVQQVS